MARAQATYTPAVEPVGTNVVRRLLGRDWLLGWMLVGSIWSGYRSIWSSSPTAPWSRWRRRLLPHPTLSAGLTGRRFPGCRVR